MLPATKYNLQDQSSLFTEVLHLQGPVQPRSFEGLLAYWL